MPAGAVEQDYGRTWQLSFATLVSLLFTHTFPIVAGNVLGLPSQASNVACAQGTQLNCCRGALYADSGETSSYYSQL